MDVPRLPLLLMLASLLLLSSAAAARAEEVAPCVTRDGNDVHVHQPWDVDCSRSRVCVTLDSEGGLPRVDVAVFCLLEHG